MNIHQSFLAGLHPQLVSNDEAFDNNVSIEFKAFDEALSNIGEKYAEYNDDLRVEKTNADVLNAYNRLTKKLEEITAKPFAEIAVEENELTKKIADSLSLHNEGATPRCSDTCN